MIYVLATLACQALSDPCLSRRANQGCHEPEYQLEAAELAVIWWSFIYPLCIPKGTEHPANIHISPIADSGWQVIWTTHGAKDCLLQIVYLNHWTT